MAHQKYRHLNDGLELDNLVEINVHWFLSMCKHLRLKYHMDGRQVMFYL